MMKRSLVSAIAGLAIAIFSSVAIATAEYRLSVGDAVRFSVAGLPDLSVESLVDRSGSIHLPIVGAVQARGSTIVELNETVSLLFNGQIYKYVTKDGIEGIITISPQDVRVSIASYQPIAVYGAVSVPGEIVYRPGLTARGAIARAGGFRLSPLEQAPSVKAAELAGEIRSLRLRREHRRAVVSRLRTQIDSLARQQSAASAAAVREQEVDITEPQNELLERRLTAMQKETSHILRSIEQVEARLEILHEREQAEAKAASLDAEDKERIDELRERGIVAMDRVSDVRRAQLLSATRLLQTQGSIAEAEFDRTELERALDKIESEHVIELMELLETTELEIGELDATLAALEQQLFLISGSSETGDQKSVFVVILHRQADSGPEAHVMALDDQLEPGDILEVTAQAEE